MMSKPARFWMVKGRGPASYLHDSLASAESEAKRLAQLAPGQTFAVLEAVALFRKVEVERISLRPDVDDDDGLPF